MKQLLLLRHGRTVANEQRRYCGRTDSPLSEAGAEALRQRREQARYPSLARFTVYTSGLLRTEQTLRCLYGDWPHEAEPAFREIDFGAFEDRPYSELKDDPAYQAWLAGDNWANVCPGGESGVQMQARVLARLEQVLRAHDRVCIVTHGGVIAAILQHIFPHEDRHFYQWQPENGGGYLLRLDGEPAYVPVPFERADWQRQHFSFCQNRDCEYFPCHQGVPEADFNCLFCYCPLYALGEHCGGQFTYTGDGVKNCASCPLPHRRQSYGYILRRFADVSRLARRETE